ncbi:MAG: hypothetical protein JXQ83_09165 [Candidatus Glassbacteria bacterium]|nr:hypothetical protein [Candidatus Glassbacteria bacterium]
MKSRLAILVFLGSAAVSCSESEKPVNVDFLPLLHVADINFTSPTYLADSTLPLDQDLPSGTNLSYSYRMVATRLNLRQAGSDITEVESVLLRFRMSIESRGFDGTGEVTLYLGTGADVYNDPTALVLNDKKILPATFEFSSSDRRLPFILDQDEFYFGYQVLLEPLRLSSRSNSATGLIETLAAEIKGLRGIR